MNGRLHGKVALITGGASGIGKAVSIRFAREGASVLVTDITAEAARKTADICKKNAIYTELDVTQEIQWRSAMDLVIAQFGRLDILCNIAGVGIGGSIEDFNVDSFVKMSMVNVVGTMLGCKHGIRTIVASGGSGAIINMSSVAGIVPPSDIPGYAATKGAVTTLTRSIALYCAERKYPIRCVSVHPTVVDTEMLDPVAAAAGWRREDLVAKMAKQLPTGRIATADEIASGVLFAASDEAGMLSGSALVLDGAKIAGTPSSHFVN